MQQTALRAAAYQPATEPAGGSEGGKTHVKVVLNPLEDQ